MKRCKIGNTDIDLNVYYWTDGKAEWQLRQSEKYLFAELDCLQSYANWTDDFDELQELYAAMDLVWAQVQCSYAFGSDKEKLKHAGQVIAACVKNGDFSKEYYTLDEREAAVTELIESIIRRTNEGEQIFDYDESFFHGFLVNIVEKSHYFNAADGTFSDTPVEVSGIGAALVENIPSTLKRCAPWYLYTSEENKATCAKFPKANNKRSLQRLQINNMMVFGVDEITADTIIRSGIVDNCEGNSPAVVLEQFRGGTIAVNDGYAEELQNLINNTENISGTGDDAKVGNPIIVAAIIGLIGTLFTSLVSIIAQKNNIKAQLQFAKEQKEQMKNLEPTQDDWNNAYNERSEAEASRASTMMTVGVAAVAVFLGSMFFGGNKKGKRKK